jgi:hypothetical protein
VDARRGAGEPLRFAHCAFCGAEIDTEHILFDGSCPNLPPPGSMYEVWMKLGWALNDAWRSFLESLGLRRFLKR